MKRLKRVKQIVAETDLNLFLISQLNYNQHYQSEIEEIIKNNSDCLYSGMVYRGLQFHPNEIRDAYNEFLKEENEEKIDYSSLHYYVNNILNKIIRVNGVYQSFSRTFDGAYNAMKFIDEEPDNIPIIIKCEISNGLDIEKLTNKHKDKLRSETLEAFENFKNQEEILAKFEDKEFFVPDPGDLKNLFKKFEGE